MLYVIQLNLLKMKIIQILYNLNIFGFQAIVTLKNVFIVHKKLKLNTEDLKPRANVINAELHHIYHVVQIKIQKQDFVNQHMEI